MKMQNSEMKEELLQFGKKKQNETCILENLLMLSQVTAQQFLSGLSIIDLQFFQTKVMIKTYIQR